MRRKLLSREFFNRPTEKVAKDLQENVLVARNVSAKGGSASGGRVFELINTIL